MGLKLKRTLYRFENYSVKKLFNYYVIEATGKDAFLTESESLESLYKEFIDFGKTLYLNIENIKYFSRIFIKKREKIRIMPVSFNGKNRNDVIYKNEFDLHEDLEPNTNHVIFINDYDSLFQDKNITDVIINFCKQNGLPYFENLEKDTIEEGNQTDLPLCVRVKDLIFTSITVYLLTELKKILDTDLDDLNKKKLNKLMGFDTIQDKKKYIDEFNYYVESLKEEFSLYISAYKNYATPIISNTNDGYIETTNLVQSLTYYFLNCIYWNSDSFKICCRCLQPTSNTIKNLCESCFDEDPNFNERLKRKTLNDNCRDLVGRLRELNNKELNQLVDETTAVKTHFKDSSKKDEKMLFELCKKYKLI